MRATADMKSREMGREAWLGVAKDAVAKFAARTPPGGWGAGVEGVQDDPLSMSLRMLMVGSHVGRFGMRRGS